MNYGRSLYPEEMIDQLLREKDRNPREDHAQLQSAIATMRENMPRRTCPRPPPGFDRNDPYYNHVPKNRIPVQSVPHSHHEAMRAPAPKLGYNSTNILEETSVEGMCIENHRIFFYIIILQMRLERR